MPDLVAAQPLALEPDILACPLELLLQLSVRQAEQRLPCARLGSLPFSKALITPRLGGAWECTLSRATSALTRALSALRAASRRSFGLWPLEPMWPVEGCC